ncbi:MAG: hypothetical protein ACI91G_000778, partial [Gammaproteobacteria bacterium]
HHRYTASCCKAIRMEAYSCSGIINPLEPVFISRTSARIS